MTLLMVPELHPVSDELHLERCSGLPPNFKFFASDLGVSEVTEGNDLQFETMA